MEIQIKLSLFLSENYLHNRHSLHVQLSEIALLLNLRQGRREREGGTDYFRGSEIS